MKATVVTLKLESWATEIKAANTAFNKKYLERSVASGTTKADKVYVRRPAITALYEELMIQLDSWYNVKKRTQPEPWATAVGAVNGVIKTYNDILAIRAGRSGDKEDDGGSTDAPPAA